jgi:hypothetical protein
MTTLATRLASHRIATLAIHVGHVLLVRSYPQMIRIDASRKITAMADMHTDRNGAMHGYPHGSMRPDGLAIEHS